MGTFLGVPILRIIVYWGLYWGLPILGNYHITDCKVSPILVPAGSSPVSERGGKETLGRKG